MLSRAILLGFLGGGLMIDGVPATEEALLEATITRIQGREVVLNVGSPQGAQVGQEFVVVRNGEVIGRIRLTEVGEREASGEVVEGLSEPGPKIRLGDSVRSTTPVVVPPQPPAPVAKRKVKPAKVWRRPRPIRFHDIVSGEDRTYDVLRGLAARGLLRGYTARDFAGESERLFTREEIGQILAVAVTDLLAAGSGVKTDSPKSPLWTPGVVWGLGSLLPGYRRELVAAGIDYDTARQAVQARLGERSAVEEGLGFLSGTGEGRWGLSSDAATDGRWITSLGGAFNERGGAWFTLTNVRDDVGTRWRERDTVSRALVSVDLSAKDRLILGRDTMRWGPGYNGSLLLTDNPKPFDLIRYENDRLRVFRRSFFFTQFFTTYREDGERLWISGRRFATHLNAKTEVAYSEVLKMQSAHQVIPSQVFVPIYMAERYPFNIFNELQRKERQSNLLASVEISTRASPTATAYFQWLLDDFTTNKPVPRKIGWQLGGHWWRGEAGERTDLRLEYAFTDRGVYEHRQPPAAWMREGRTIGHRMGPDAQDLYLRVRRELAPNEDLTLIYNWGRHGRSLSPTEESPEQAPEQETLWSLAYGRDFSTHLSVGGRYLHHRRHNAGQVLGESRTDDRWLVEARFGF